MSAAPEERMTVELLKPGMKNWVYRFLSRSKLRYWSPGYVNKRIRQILIGSQKNALYACTYLKVNNIFIPNDYYWASYISNLSAYEPEVGSLLLEILGDHTAFIDCGANVGLWSCVASHYTQRPSQVLAVEAGSQIMETLVRNSQNKGFTIIPKVIFREARPSIPFYEYGERHSHNSIFFDKAYSDAEPRMVKSTTLDEIADTLVTQPNLVIKLDIEGGEKDAFLGAKKLLESKQNVIFIYEDHGKNPASNTTMFCLKDLRLNVHYIDHNKRLECMRIRTLDDVLLNKVNKRRGYNFVSTIPGTSFDQKIKSISRR